MVCAYRGASRILLIVVAERPAFLQLRRADMTMDSAAEQLPVSPPPLYDGSDRLIQCHHTLSVQPDIKKKDQMIMIDPPPHGFGLAMPAYI